MVGGIGFATLRVGHPQGETYLASDTGLEWLGLWAATPVAKRPKNQQSPQPTPLNILVGGIGFEPMTSAM